MKTPIPGFTSRCSLLTCVLLAIGSTARSADSPTLKEAYKDHFYVGVAINRDMATGATNQTGYFNRTPEQVDKDIALVKEQFNQIVPENDLKWALIHPREGADGYDFGPADAFVNFGVSNHMYIVGHTLVWHGQTPNWVFAGTNPRRKSPTPRPDLSRKRTSPEQMRPAWKIWPRISAAVSDINGPRASREELLQRMHDHIYYRRRPLQGQGQSLGRRERGGRRPRARTYCGIRSGCKSSGRTSSPRPSNTPTKRIRMRSSATTTMGWKTRRNATNSSL